jgi:hypothetical protein
LLARLAKFRSKPRLSIESRTRGYWRRRCHGCPDAKFGGGKIRRNDFVRNALGKSLGRRLEAVLSTRDRRMFTGKRTKKLTNVFIRCMDRSRTSVIGVMHAEQSRDG